MCKRDRDDVIGWAIFFAVALAMLGLFAYLAIDCGKPQTTQKSVIPAVVQPVVVPVAPVKPPCPCPGQRKPPKIKNKPPVAPPVKPEPPKSPAKPVEPKLPPNVTCGAEKPARVIAFTASWCGPCQKAKPKLEQIRKKGVEVVEIDIDKDPKAAKHAKITSVPTIYVCWKGKHKPQKVRDVDEAMALIP